MSELVDRLVHGLGTADFLWVRAVTAAEINFVNWLLWPALKTVAQSHVRIFLANACRNTLLVERYVDPEIADLLESVRMRDRRGEIAYGDSALLCVQSAHHTTAYAVPRHLFVMALALIGDHVYRLRGAPPGCAFGGAVAGIPAGLDRLLLRCGQGPMQADVNRAVEYALKCTLVEAQEVRPAEQLGAWLEFGDRFAEPASLYDSIAMWCSVHYMLMMPSETGVPPVDDVVQLYNLGRLQRFVVPDHADYQSVFDAAEAGAHGAVLVSGGLWVPDGEVNEVAQWCAQMAYARRLLCDQTSGASAGTRQLGLELVRTHAMDRRLTTEYCANVSPWYRALLMRLAPQRTLVLDPRGTHREPLALLTALRTVLPGMRDGVDYVLVAEHRAYIKSARRRRKPTRAAPPDPYLSAVVALSADAAETLQVGTQALLCAQRAIARDTTLRTARNRDCAVASPLLAHTLAQSSNLTNLCHALNALGALVGLSNTEWHADSAHAQQYAAITARLCARAADAFVGGSAQRAVDCTLGRLWAYTNDVFKKQRCELPRTNPTAIAHKNPERGQLEHYHVGGLHSLLQVILLAHRLPVVAPRAACSALLDDDVLECVWLRDDLESMRCRPDETYDEWRVRDRSTLRSAINTPSHDTSWYDELVISTGRAKRDASSDQNSIDQLRRRAQARGIALCTRVCACGASSAVCDTLLRHALDPASRDDECCICGIDRLPIPESRVRSLSYMQGVCQHCLARVPWQTRMADRRVDEPGAWIIVDRERGLELISLLLTAEEDAEEREQGLRCIELLSSLRQRVRHWLTNAGTLRPFWRTGKHGYSLSVTTTRLWTVLTRASTLCASAETNDAVQSALAERVADSREPRNSVLLATLAQMRQAPPTPIRCGDSHSLGLFMVAAELVCCWEQMALMAVYQEGQLLTQVLSAYLAPLRDRGRYSAYVMHQRTDTYFPLIESALLGTTAPDLLTYEHAADTAERHIARLLDDHGRPRPLTDTAPWMLETILLNWYA